MDEWKDKIWSVSIVDIIQPWNDFSTWWTLKKSTLLKTSHLSKTTYVWYNSMGMSWHFIWPVHCKIYPDGLWNQCTHYASFSGRWVWRIRVALKDY